MEQKHSYSVEKEHHRPVFENALFTIENLLNVFLFFFFFSFLFFFIRGMSENSDLRWYTFEPKTTAADPGTAAPSR